MLERISKSQQTVLSRISHLGMQQAAEVLSRLLRQQVTVSVADVLMSDCLHEAPVDSIHLGVCMRVSGDVTGGLLLALSEPCATWLSGKLLGNASADLLAEPACSTLKEVGNIIASSFLACLDDQLALRSLPSPPQLKRAPLKELLLDCHANDGDTFLIVRAQLQSDTDSGENLQGSIYLFPRAAALTKLLAQIGSG